MTTPAVTAVIVTYRSRETVGAALDALAEAHLAGLAEAVVVDNASDDGTADFVAERYPWVILVRSAENLGFGRGCNLGFEQVRTPYVLMLNPDAVIGPDSLRILIEFMESHPAAGIAAPAIIEDENHFQQAGLMTTPLSLLKGACGWKRPMKEQQPIVPGSSPFRTPWICGAVMLIRSGLFRSLGGFDPRFFLYFEETDLCRRATTSGTEIWAVGDAVAEHAGGASAKGTGQTIESSCISEHYYRSRFYYLVKHFGWARATLTELILRLFQILRMVRNGALSHGATSGKPVSQVRPFLQLPAHPVSRKFP